MDDTAATTGDGGTAITAETRNRLDGLRRGLLGLHKALLDAERRDYEYVHGQVNNAELLRLALQHPDFAWLRPLSELIVRIDEATDPATATRPAATESEARDVIAVAAALLRQTPEGGAFGAKYRQALQASPEIVMAHAALRPLLPAAPEAGDAA